MQIFGSTRLTQISAVSLLLSGVCAVVVVFCGSSVCVVVVVLSGSFCVCVVIVVSFCVGLTVVFPDVFVSVKMISENLTLYWSLSFFLADITSLAFSTDVVEDVLCTSCCGNFVNSDFPFFSSVVSRLCRQKEKLSSRSDEPCQL